MELLRWKDKELCEDSSDALMRVFPQVLLVRGHQREEIIVQDPQAVVDSEGVGLAKHSIKPEEQL